MVLKPKAGKAAPAAPVTPADQLATPPADSTPNEASASLGPGTPPGAALELPAGLPAAPADSSTQSVEGAAHEVPLWMEKSAVHGLHIRSVPESFRRCGRRFTREGVSIALDDLEDEQIDQLARDPNLVVEHHWLTDPAQG